MFLVFITKWQLFTCASTMQVLVLFSICMVANAIKGIYFHRENKMYLANKMIRALKAGSAFECSTLCTITPDCQSVNYKTSGTNKGRCELNDASSINSKKKENKEFVYLELVKQHPVCPAEIESSCSLKSANICQCLHEHGNDVSRVYNIATPNCTTISKYCDQTTDGGGWLVIQRNNASGIWFDKNWLEYKYGFGNLMYSFWWGNEKVHQYTLNGRYELRVDLMLTDGSGFAKYNDFKLNGEIDKYRLVLKNDMYSGNVDDSFFNPSHQPHQSAGKKFTTKDQDNDSLPGGNCASERKAGGWYDWCSLTVLNKASPQWKNLNNKIIKTEMKIRQMK